MYYKATNKLIRIPCKPSADTEKNLLYVREIGYIPSELAGHTPRQMFDLYLIAFVIKGRGFVNYENIDYRVCEGQGIFIHCLNEHSFRCDPEDPWEVLWIYFDGHSAGYYYNIFQKNGCCVFFPQSPNDFTTILFDILANISQRTNYSEIITSKFLTDILTSVVSQQIVENPDEHSSYHMKSVKEYIDLHFIENINLDDIAAAFYMNKYSLSREFKKEYGETIFQHIIKRRINYAKELLKFTNKTVDEIAHLCGFNDQCYFSRQFKKITGVSSMVYRKQSHN